MRDKFGTITIIISSSKVWDVYLVSFAQFISCRRLCRERPVVCHRLACPSRIGQNCSFLLLYCDETILRKYSLLIHSQFIMSLLKDHNHFVLMTEVFKGSFLDFMHFLLVYQATTWEITVYTLKRLCIPRSKRMRRYPGGSFLTFNFSGAFALFFHPHPRGICHPRQKKC